MELSQKLLPWDRAVEAIVSFKCKLALATEHFFYLNIILKSKQIYLILFITFRHWHIWCFGPIVIITRRQKSTLFEQWIIQTVAEKRFCLWINAEIRIQESHEFKKTIVTWRDSQKVRIFANFHSFLILSFFVGHRLSTRFQYMLLKQGIFLESVFFYQLSLWTKSVSYWINLIFIKYFFTSFSFWTYRLWYSSSTSDEIVKFLMSSVLNTSLV